MQTKVFSICLDMQQTLPFHPFEVVDGDTGNVLHITLQNNAEALLLNDCAVMVLFTSSMGFAMQDETSGVTVCDDPGTFTMLLDPNNYGPGIVSVDVQVYSGPNHNVLVTSTRFDFRCRRSLISAEIIRANVAYPPLVTSAQEARDATAAAIEAVATLGSRLGETNVQADWTQQDSTSDAFIRNKPLLTPYALGAAEATHASRHATGGDDPVTPASIGAAVVYTEQITLTPDDWLGDKAPYTKQAVSEHATASCHIIVAPSVGHEQEYAACEIRLTQQAYHALTFSCKSKPEANIAVNAILIYGNEETPQGITTDNDDVEMSNAEILGIWNNE